MIEPNAMTPPVSQKNPSKWRKSFLRHLFINRKSMGTEGNSDDLNPYPFETQLCGGRFPLRVLLDYVDDKLSDEELDVLSLYFDDYPMELDLVIGIKRFYDDTGMNRKELETYLEDELPSPDFLYDKTPTSYSNKPLKKRRLDSRTFSILNARRKLFNTMSYAASIGLALIISFILLPPNMKRNPKTIPIDRTVNSSSHTPNTIEHDSPVVPSHFKKHVPKSAKKVAHVYKSKQNLSRNMASQTLFTDHNIDK